MSLRKLLLLTVLLLIVCGALFAQDDSRTSEDIVLDAIEQLAAADSYHFEATSILTQIYEYADDDTDNPQEIVTETLSTGDFSGEDYQMTQILTGSSPDESETVSIDLSRIFADGVFYIRATADEDIMITSFYDNLPTAWTVYMPYNGSDATTTELILNSFFGSPPPTVLPLRVGTINNVTESDNETLNDIEMRVFDIDLDGLAVALQNIPGNSLEALGSLLLEEDSVYRVSEYDLSMTLWLGAEDGRIYQAMVYSNTYLPLLDAGIDYAPFNQRIITETTLTISDYGEPVTITAPEIDESEGE